MSDTKQTATGGMLVAVNEAGEERALLPVEFFNCAEAAQVLLGWHRTDPTRRLRVRANAHNEMREALESSRDTLASALGDLQSAAPEASIIFVIEEEIKRINKLFAALSKLDQVRS